MAYLTTNPSPFLINVPELQNVLTSATGASSTQALSNTLNDILNFIDTANSQVNINTIGSQTTSAVTFTSNINLSNSIIQFLGSNLLGSNTLNGPAGHLAFQVSGIERARLTTAGLTVGGPVTASGFITSDTIPGPEFLNDLSGAAIVRGPLYVSTFGAVVGNIVASGTVTANGIVYPSDSRLKKNLVEYVSPGLPTPYRFDWRSSGEADIGVLADEVRILEPACVKTAANGMLTVDYPRLCVLLLAEVRDLKAKVQELTARLP